MDLTDRQREILNAIRQAIQTHGYPPTVREICAAVGLSSPASVHSHLAALEQKGYLRRGLLKRRALELTDLDRARHAVRGRLLNLPVVGHVAAGFPLFAEDNVEEILEIPEFLTAGDGCFVLKVRGSSMKNAGILDGDLVVVRRQDDAENGDIVVALLEDEATLKRFYRETNWVRLQPENDTMRPILTRDPRIVGKVTGVMRRV